MVLFNRRKYMKRRGSPQGAPADIADAVVTLSTETVTYTGNPVYPTVSVTYDGATLVVNTDYTLNYSDNTNVGAATVVVTGMGEFAGQVVKTFQIVSADDVWNFDISKTDSTPDATYEVADLGNYSGLRLHVFNGGFITSPCSNGSFTRYELPSLSSTTTGAQPHNMGGGISVDGKHFVYFNDRQLLHAESETANDISSLSFAAKKSSVEVNASRKIVISGDGLHVFLIGAVDYGYQGKIFRHDLTSAFDFSTISNTIDATISFGNVSAGYHYQDFCFAPGGRKMLWFDNKTASVFNLGVAWDPSTATLAKSKEFSAGVTNPAVAVDSDGTHFYLAGDGYLRVFTLTA